jgi:hypothetical protein
VIGPWFVTAITRIPKQNLGITSDCLQGIDNAEIIQTVHARRAPMVPVTSRSNADGGVAHRANR